jgi:hypothetical protein
MLLSSNAEVCLYDAKAIVSQLGSLSNRRCLRRRRHCLARRGALNGRQIKHAVRSAQALAVNEKKPQTMDYVLKMLEVVEAFEQDLKGGMDIWMP